MWHFDAFIFSGCGFTYNEFTNASRLSIYLDRSASMFEISAVDLLTTPSSLNKKKKITGKSGEEERNVQNVNQQRVRESPAVKVVTKIIFVRIDREALKYRVWAETLLQGVSFLISCSRMAKA